MFIRKVIFLLLLIFTCISCTKINDPDPEIQNLISAYRQQPDQRIDVKDFWDAIDLACTALYNDTMTKSFGYDMYVLTSSQQILKNNKWIWRVTFKPKQLVSDDPSKGPLALGGEAFVNVDLSTKETTVTYGE